MTYPTKKIGEWESEGVIELGRGEVISKIDISNNLGGFPIYSAAQLNDGEFGHWSKYNFDEELITWSVDGGGKFFHRPKHKFSVTNVCGWMRILKPEVLDYKFLYFVLRQQHDNLLFDYVNKAHPSVIRPLYSIPIPPMGEQRKIVARIEKQFAKIDEAARKRAESQALTEKLLPAALHEIFSRIKSDPTTLGSLSKMVSGGTPSRAKSQYWQGDIPWVISRELNDEYIDETKECITEIGLKESNAKVLPKGTLLIGMYDTGAMKMSITKRPAATNQAIIGLLPSENFLAEFIYYQLMFLRPQILLTRQGIRQKNLNATKVKNINITLPPLADQKKIVKKLDALAEKARAVRGLQSAQSADLKSLKQSILHEAFAG